MQFKRTIFISLLADSGYKDYMSSSVLLEKCVCNDIIVHQKHVLLEKCFLYHYFIYFVCLFRAQCCY